jgi:hypothetical protein
MDEPYLPATASHANHDLTPDGKQLLVLEGERPQLLVVHDWAAEARAKLKQAREDR